MQDVILLGATGSIGESALKVIKELNLNLEAISFNKNLDRALEIIKAFNVKKVICYNLLNADKLKKAGLSVFIGNKGLEKLLDKKSVVLNGIGGGYGIKPSLITVKKGSDLLIANKESILTIGNELKEISKKTGSKIIPIDSEHMALLQVKSPKTKKCVITASGGSLFEKERDAFSRVTKKEILNHPVWKMGNLITVNSSNLANKGIEVMEAVILFDIDYADILVKREKRGIIHALAINENGDIYQHESPPSMSLFIKAGFFILLNKKIDFFKISKIDIKSFNMLEDIPKGKFLLYDLALTYKDRGELFPMIFASIVEALTELFLIDKITYLEIESLTYKYINHFCDHKKLSAEEKINYYFFIKDFIIGEINK